MANQRPRLDKIAGLCGTGNLPTALLHRWDQKKMNIYLGTQKSRASLYGVANGKGAGVPGRRLRLALESAW